MGKLETGRPVYKMPILATYKISRYNWYCDGLYIITPTIIMGGVGWRVHLYTLYYKGSW